VIKQSSGYVSPFSEVKRKLSLGEERECRAPFPKPISYVEHFQPENGRWNCKP